MHIHGFIVHLLHTVYAQFIHPISIYIYIYAYICIHVYKQIYTYKYRCVCVYVYLSVCVPTSICVHTPPEKNDNDKEWVSRVFMRVPYEIFETPAFWNGARVLIAKTWAKFQEWH